VLRSYRPQGMRLFIYMIQWPATQNYLDKAAPSYFCLNNSHFPSNRFHLHRGVCVRGIAAERGLLFLLCSLHATVPGLRFPFPRNSRAMAKKHHFTWYFRGILNFRGISAGFPCRGHKGTAKFPSRKSRLIGKFFPFRGNSADFPAGNLTQHGSAVT